MTVDPPISQPPAPVAGTGQDAAGGSGTLLLEEEFGGGPLYSLRQAVAAHASAAGMSGTGPGGDGCGCGAGTTRWSARYRTPGRSRAMAGRLPGPRELDPVVAGLIRASLTGDKFATGRILTRAVEADLDDLFVAFTMANLAGRVLAYACGSEAQAVALMDNLIDGLVRERTRAAA